VLADERADWRPSSFHSSLWGCTASLVFPTVKLLDYTDEAALEQDPNPFATVVLTHRKTQQTRDNPESRRAWKLRLARGLYERGWSPEDVLELLRFIDWMMELPPALAQQFRQDIYQYEKEKQMPYVTSFERMAEQRGIEKGLREGLLKGLAQTIEIKFGARGKRLMTRIHRITDVAALEALHQTALTAASLDQLRQALP
jgi:hypothetical protein